MFVFVHFQNNLIKSMIFVLFYVQHSVSVSSKLTFVKHVNKLLHVLASAENIYLKKLTACKIAYFCNA